MPIEDYRAIFGSLWQRLRAGIAGWLRPTHPRFAVHLFIAALGSGLLLGLAWIATHQIVVALRSPTAAGAQLSGPGAPLPTPMTGGNAALPMASTASQSLAMIDDQAPVAAAADVSADVVPVLPDTQDTTALPALAADTARPADREQPISATDPGQSMHAGPQREVTLSVEIDEQGNPLQIAVEQSSGSAALDNVALLQVRARHFAPTLSDGEPVPATLNVTVRFPSGDH